MPGSLDSKKDRRTGPVPPDAPSIPISTAFPPLQAGWRPAVAEAERGHFDSVRQEAFSDGTLACSPSIPHPPRTTPRCRPGAPMSDDPMTDVRLDGEGTA